MPWVRFDDQFPIHRKVARLSDAAFRLHVSAIFWCARNLTDGCVSEEDLDDVCARVRTPARFAAELVDRGLWHEAGHPCASQNCAAPAEGSGWVIHDYLEFQPSAQRVREDRAATAVRQKRWRENHRDRNASSNGVTNAGTNAAPSRPDPSRKPPTDSLRSSVPPEGPDGDTEQQPKPKAKRGTRIPDDFALTDAMRTWGRENFPDVDGERETEAFIDYWRGATGQRATKLDWQATWRNWIRKAAERAPTSRNGYQPRPGDDLGSDAHMQRFLARRAAARADTERSPQ